MHDDKWVSVDSYADRFSAEALVGLLAGEGVPAHIASDEPIPGLGRNFAVLVPPELLQRAQSIVEQAPVSDKELTRLAMDNPGPTDEGSSGSS